MTVISLTTDFGSGDHEAGVLKGVIWNINPSVNIVDLSHGISPQEIFEVGLLLSRAVPYFPDGTVHLAVVDPGVGTSRRGIAALIGTQYVVGPDNGTISILLHQAEEHGQEVHIVSLDKPGFWLSEVSSIFHGRDIFAPVSAHLSRGIPLDVVGTAISDPIRLEIPLPLRIADGWRGQVIHIDHFGNLSTNLKKIHLDRSKEMVINIKGKKVAGLSTTFGDRPPGSLVALLDSSGSLAISTVNGNAAASLPASVGDLVELHILE